MNVIPAVGTMLLNQPETLRVRSRRDNIFRERRQVVVNVHAERDALGQGELDAAAEGNDAEPLAGLREDGDFAQRLYRILVPVPL